MNPALFGNAFPRPAEDRFRSRRAKPDALNNLVALIIGSTVGQQTSKRLFNNFPLDVAELSGREGGIIQSIREIPGNLALGVVFDNRWVHGHPLFDLNIC